MEIEHLSKHSKEIHKDLMTQLEQPNHDNALRKFYTENYQQQSQKIDSKYEELLELQKQLAIKGFEFETFKKNTLADLFFATSELALEIRKELKMLLDD